MLHILTVCEKIIIKMPHEQSYNSSDFSLISFYFYFVLTFSLVSVSFQSGFACFGSVFIV